MTEAARRKEKVRYNHDALGRRVQRIAGNGKENTKFIHDGEDVLVDDNSGTLTKYLNGEGIDNKLRQTVGSTASYFLGDHLGSTNGLADSSGSLTASTAYDSFGNATSASFPSRYQFTGREYDSFSGFHYYRARWFDGKLGRFMSEDPIGFGGGGVNLYGYVKNKPLNRRDPMGLDDADRAYYDTLPPGWDQPIRTVRPPNRGRWGPIGAVGDFTGNYSDMRRANTVGADKFFHCMANCEASRRGITGYWTAGVLSEGRELFDQYLKGDPIAACNQDRFANNTGALGGLGAGRCSQVCSPFRPAALQYPLPPLPPIPKSPKCWGGARGC
jgi:RHS repeat-associated protein